MRDFGKMPGDLYVSPFLSLELYPVLPLWVRM